MSADYRVRVMDGFASPDLVREWNVVASGVRHRLGWFQSPQWALSWWETVGRGSEPLVLGVFAGNELVAVAPWCVSDGTVRCMGDPLNDVNAVPTRGGHDEEAVLRALLRALGPIMAERGLAAQTLVLECWPAPLARAADGVEVEALPPLESPVVDLPANWDAYLASLASRRRMKLAQVLRRLPRSRPGLRLEVATDPDRALELGRVMLALREEALGPRGLIPDCEPTSRAAPFGALLARLVTREGAAPRVLVGALVDRDEVLAAGLYFRWWGFLMKYMQGWRLPYAAWSPGTLLDLEMIRHGVERGVRVLELGRGDEPYKARLGARPNPLHGCTVSLRAGGEPDPHLQRRVSS